MALRCAIWLCILLCPAPAVAQHLLQIKRLNLPSEGQDIQLMLTDGFGMLWLAGADGLVSFDGSNTVPHFLKGKRITALAAKGDDLWASTATGMLYTLGAGHGQLLDSVQLIDTTIVHLQRIPPGLLVGTEGAGAFLLGEGDTLHIDQSMLKDPAVHGAAFEERSGRLFLATDAGVEILKLDASGLKAEPLHFIPLPLAASLQLLEGTLLVSDYRKQWFRVSLSANMADWVIMPHLTEAETHSAFTSMLHMQPSALLATSSGLFLQGGIPDQSVQLSARTDYKAASLSAEGIAIALRTDGMLECYDLRFSNWPSLQMPGLITSLSIQDEVLALSSEGLLRLVDLHTGVQRDLVLPASSVVVDMAWQGPLLYLGSFNNGVLAIDPALGMVDITARAQGLPDNNVLAIAAHNDGLWVSTLGGLSVITPDGTIAEVPAPEAAGATYTYALQSTPGGMVLGTDGRGAFIYQKGSWQGLMPDSLMKVASVYQVLEAGADSLYLITKSSGLFRLALSDLGLQSLPQASAKNGFFAHGPGPNGSLLRNADGVLEWMSAARHLTFGESHGMQWNESPYFHTIDRYTPTLSFAAKGQEVLTFHQQPSLTVTPRPFITGMEVDLMPHHLSQHDLGAGSKRLSFHFNAAWLQAPDDLSFSYKLEGADVNWQPTTERRAVYSSLGPGRYTFHLRAQAGDAAHNQSATLSYEFVIAPPLYLRWWFIAVVALLVAAIIYALFRIRIASLNRRRLAEQREAEGRLQHLRDQVNPHFLFNSFNTLLSMVETQPKAAAEYVQRLSDFYRKVLEQDNRAWHTVGEELTMLESYIYLQQMRFGEALQLDTKVDHVCLTCFIPSLSLQLLAENAVKHNRISQKETLVISIFVENEALVMRNNKIAKREVAPGTGTGLSNIADRYRMQGNAALLVHDGTEYFEVRLPVLKTISQ